jgi:uncharacterized membrane protein (UPF0127 family)
VATLFNRSTNQILSQNLAIADSMTSRMKGLLGKTELVGDEMLWIQRCNSIHTFFMKFSIDCIFLNSQMNVCAVRRNVLPWRMVWPILSARSVIELPAGQAEVLKVSLGDQLHVGH